MRLSRALVAIALIVFAFSAPVSAQTVSAGASVAGEILVKFRPGVTANAKADAHRQAGGTLRSEIARTGVQLVAVPTGDQTAAIARYQRNPNVLYAEPNRIRSVPTPSFHAPGSEVVPGDYYFLEQWALHNTGQEFYCFDWPFFGHLCFYVGTPNADIDAPEAWAISTGSSAVKVAVIDTGIDYTHPDLAATYAGGYNYVSPGSGPMDDHGHGTHVSGTIAAALDNLTGDPATAEGVVGVAPNARILAYKVCTADGTCSDFDIELALAQAITDGAKVINMSLGGPDYSRSMDDGVQDAWSAGLVIIAAAGNDGNTNLFYPASLDHVISVAAFDEDDRRATFSNYGSWVDISAPGNVIMSTYPLAACVVADVPGDTGCYTWLSGTSMASPHVSGAAALVWSRSDVTSNQQVVDILLNSADRQGVDAVRLDSWTAHGGLNIHDALSYGSTNLRPVANAGVDQTLTDTDGDGAEIVTLDGSASSDADGSIVTYAWREGSTVVGAGATPSVWLSVGSHTLTLEVTDNLGDSGTDSVAVTVNAMNRVPVANAGADQTVTDTDGNSVELVTLDGSASSDSDGTIVRYAWREGSTTVGAGATPAVSLAVGSHTLTLEVTDDRGGSGTDSVVVTVQPMNQAPVANAGIDQTVTDTDGNGAESVTLNGSASSDSDGSIVSYAWREGSTSVGVGATPAVSLAVGSHTLTLEVTDDRGGSGTDSVVVMVQPMNHPPVAGNTSVTTVLGIPVTVTLSATDLETCELAFAVVQVPTGGTLGAVGNQACVAGTPNSDTAQITYTPGSTAGTYSFTYKVNDGSADSNVATATITVTAPPPPVGVSVTGINPNVVSQSAGVVTFVITGTGFASGASVAFLNGSGPAPRVISVTRDSSTQLTASVEIRSGGPRKNRLWDVGVTNPDGSTAVRAGLLTITP